MKPRFALSPHKVPTAGATMGQIKTDLGLFDIAIFSGVNESGFEAVGDRVLVLPDQPSGAVGSIELPEEYLDRLAMSAETGIIVHIGESAWLWNSDRTRRFEGSRPEVGTRVFFNRYSGIVAHGQDGRIYRFMDDTCIGGVHAMEGGPKPSKRKAASPSLVTED